jgi:hypothetical protein
VLSDLASDLGRASIKSLAAALFKSRKESNNYRFGCCKNALEMALSNHFMRIISTIKNWCFQTWLQI